MSKVRGLLTKARRLAEERLPDRVLDAGRRLEQRVSDQAANTLASLQAKAKAEHEGPWWKRPLSDALSRLSHEAHSDVSATPSTTTPSASSEDAQAPSSSLPRREDPQKVLERVQTKSEHGLKPEDRLIVIYATPAEAAEVAEIRRDLHRVEATVREVDLSKEPQTAKQIAELSNVMVPPYVFINGRYWGGQYEIAALAVTGDLEKVVANQLDELGQEARRIGNVHETFSDDITEQNILDRWKRGHILCVDDLDSWYEVDRQGEAHFYYQGGPKPVEQMPAIAREIVAGVEAEAMDVQWLLDPAVHLN